ncbi:unnamed protein product [Merluccius merluccius]
MGVIRRSGKYSRRFRLDSALPPPDPRDAGVVRPYPNQKRGGGRRVVGPAGETGCGPAGENPAGGSGLSDEAQR